MSTKMLDEMRDLMRRRHYSIHAERTCCDWVKRYSPHFSPDRPTDGVFSRMPALQNRFPRQRIVRIRRIAGYASSENEPAPWPSKKYARRKQAVGQRLAERGSQGLARSSVARTLGRSGEKCGLTLENPFDLGDWQC